MEFAAVHESYYKPSGRIIHHYNSNPNAGTNHPSNNPIGSQQTSILPMPFQNPNTICNPHAIQTQS